MPSLLIAIAACVTGGLSLPALPAATVSPVSASLSASGEAVRSGADGYTPWSNTPAGGPVGEIAGGGPDIEPSDGLDVRCHADGMGGCVVPVCGDRLAAGECRVPTVGITVTPSRSMAVLRPRVIRLGASGDQNEVPAQGGGHSMSAGGWSDGRYRRALGWRGKEGSPAWQG